MPILTAEEIQKNDARRADLIKLIKSGSALLFLGAGCSVPAGYPDWPGLVRDLETLETGFPVNADKAAQRPLEYVDDIKDFITGGHASLGRYHSRLTQLFGPDGKPRFSEVTSLFVNLPFKGIITSNYDTGATEALRDRHVGHSFEELTLTEETNNWLVSQFFLSLDSEEYRSPQRIVHPHGIYSRPTGIILSARDYESAYGTSAAGAPRDWTLHRKFLWSIMATRRLVFVGFSFNDPYLGYLLSLVANDLWRWRSAVHYAIMPVSGEDMADCLTRANNLYDQYGVEVVFYENPDGQHAGLMTVGRECATACNTEWTRSATEGMRDDQDIYRPVT